MVEMTPFHSRVLAIKGDPGCTGICWAPGAEVGAMFRALEGVLAKVPADRGHDCRRRPQVTGPPGASLPRP